MKGGGAIEQHCVRDNQRHMREILDTFCVWNYVYVALMTTGHTVRVCDLQLRNV